MAFPAVIFDKLLEFNFEESLWKKGELCEQ